MNVSEGAFDCRFGGPVTVRVTGTICGLLLTPVAVTLIWPVYVPGVRPVVVIVGVMLPGVLPLDGVTPSQFGLAGETSDAAALKVKFVPELVTGSAVTVGVGPPI